MATRTPFLRDYQARVFLMLKYGVARGGGETFTVLFPRQAGKNEVAAALVASLLCDSAKEGGTVVVCAPTMSPQAEISIARVRAALAHMAVGNPVAAGARVNGSTIRVGKAEAVFLTALPGAHVAGHTASLALIADEAQEIDEEWFDRQFRPMAASTGAATVLFGTPWSGDTLLDRAVARNRTRDAARIGRPYDGYVPFHHEVSWEEVARSLPPYGPFIEGERDRLGARNPLFRTQYGLETVATAGRLLTGDDLDRIEGEHPRLLAPDGFGPFVAGLDLGGDRPGADATVLTIAKVVGLRCEVVQHISWQGEPYAEVEAAIEALVREWRFARICIDGTGIGSTLAAHLETELGTNAERLTFNQTVKTDLGYGLIAAAATGRVKLYRDDGSPEAGAVRAQLRQATSESKGPGALRWGAPSGAHDDYAVSLALAVRAASSLGPPRVAQGRSRA